MSFGELIAITALRWIASPIVSRFMTEGFSYVGMSVPNELKELETDILPKILLVMKGTLTRSNFTELGPWLQRLKDAYYVAEDLLEEAQYQKAKKRLHPKNRTLTVRIASYPVIKPVAKFFSGKVSKLSNLSPQKRKLLRRFTKLKKDVKGLVKDARNISVLLQNQLQIDTATNTSVRDTSSLPLNDLVVGRDKDCRIIIQLLMDNTNGNHKNPVVAIVGRGGAGKTTLAKCVYNHERVIRYFDKRIWVCLTRKLNILEHTKQMIESATPEDSPKQSNLDALQNKLKIILAKSKNILVVLDDVWYENKKNRMVEEEWEKLMSPFNSHRKCTILVTSQLASLPVALHTQNSISLTDLSVADLALLFRHYAYLDEVKDSHLKYNLQTIGDQIVKNMGHSPLATKAVASRLGKNLDLNLWRDTLERENLSETTDPLMWSFQQLDEPVQRCFMYCGVFPKSFQFTKSMMIEMWVALNFIRASDASRVWMVGDEYFNTLVDSLFIQPTLRSTPRETFYSMHDSFHDLAERLSQNECFRIEDDNVIEVPPTICHLSINVSTINSQLEHNICKLVNLRTLIVLPTLVDGSDNILERILGKLKKLRVLQLILYSIEELPKTVFDLRYLKLLNIEHTSIEERPASLSKLYLLQSVAMPNYGYKDIAGLRWVASRMVTRLIIAEFHHVGMEAPRELLYLQDIIFPWLSPIVKAVPKSWLLCLKNAYIEAEDFLDEVKYLRAKKMFTSSTNSELSRIFSRKMARRPSLLFPRERKLWARFTNLKDNFNKLVEGANNFRGLLVNQPRNTTMNVGDPTILDNCPELSNDYCLDIQYRVRKLLLQEVVGESSHQSYSVVAIVGGSRVDRTVIAQNVFNNNDVVSHFDMRIWVCLTHKLDIVEHTKKMIQSATRQDRSMDEFLTFKEKESNNLRILQDHLKDILLRSKKNILLVLEDVWYHGKVHEKSHWENLMKPFTFGKCKVILTSQWQDLPAAFHTGNSIRLKGHKIDDPVSLFKNYLHLEEIMDPDSRTEFHRIRDRIVMKLSRSPLAARAVASQLRTQLKMDVWQDALESADLSETMDALLWCFEQLKAPLQRCFQDCSVFPRGFEYKKEMLIERWRALNFIPSLCTNSGVEDIGDKYFSEMVDSFFIQPSNTREFYYTIHGSFHDLAERLSRDDCFRIEDHKMIRIPPTVCHLGIDAHSIKQYVQDICKLENLRSLITTKPLEEDSVAALKKIFAKLKKLRVLQLRLSDGIEELPHTVFGLKYLKMLGIDQTAINLIPEKLSKSYLLQVVVVPDSAESRTLANYLQHDFPCIRVLRQAEQEPAVW